ncbi:MAG: hypothetical protein ABH986_03945 [archaeon]
MEPEYLSELKKQIEKGLNAKRFGTFVLVILMMVFLLNFGLDNPIGNAIEPQNMKTCSEIKGSCSETPCGQGFELKENYCENSLNCCVKAKQ